MKQQQKRLRISTLALAMMMTYQVQADDVERDSILDISEVIVVHGERSSVTEAATTHWSIDEDEIKATGAQSLDQVLKTVPGIYVRVGGQGTPRVDIRGFKARHVIYLINGVPANDAEDGQFDPSVIPTSQIASVEVSVGPSSVLYGPGGAGGVINIITKQGDRSPAVSGRLEVAQDHTFNGDISVAGSGDKWQGLVNYTRQQTDGWPMSDDYEDTDYQQGDIRQNADKTVDNLYAQGSYLISDKTQLMANLSVKDGEWGKPSRDGRGSGKVKYERVDDYQAHTVQLGVAHKFNDQFTLRGFGYQNQSEVLESEYKDETYLAVKSQQNGTSIVQGGNVQLISNFDDAGILTTAVIAEKQSWESYTIDGGDDDFDDSSWLYTAALEYQYQADDYGVVIGASAHDQDRVADSEVDYSGQLSGYWQASETTRLNMGVARKVRFPSMRNLYAMSVGNADLQAETSQHFELGLQQQLGQATALNIAGYSTDAEDYIAKDVDGFYQNMERYNFKGVDVQLENNSFDALSMALSYSFIDADDHGTQTLEYRPKHQVRFQADYELPFAMRINFNVERVMDQVYYAQEKVNGVTTTVEQSLQDYTLVDINVVQPFLDDKLELYLRATNLLDENYDQSEALPQAGRQVFIGINWQI
ncbi:TonB-dependent siderophore receptor [Shewanella sp. UCD-KL21]|uniref:TonB-dependent receptor plug domain-containing protein n=1 Tax=Shewanella sp. UCD-KL21 TaxID=1917164 RepID=UPI00097131C1|nr:TonB-dependent receptor [Shewanella sp. UCD-KL21]